MAIPKMASVSARRLIRFAHGSRVQNGAGDLTLSNERNAARIVEITLVRIEKHFSHEREAEHAEKEKCDDPVGGHPLHLSIHDFITQATKSRFN